MIAGRRKKADKTDTASWSVFIYIEQMKPSQCFYNVKQKLSKTKKIHTSTASPSMPNRSKEIQIRGTEKEKKKKDYYLIPRVQKICISVLVCV